MNDWIFRMLVVLWALLLFTVRSISPDSDVTEKLQTTDPRFYPEGFSGGGPVEETGNTAESPGQTSASILSARHDNASATCDSSSSSNLIVNRAASQNATGAKQPEISAEITIGESNALNLTCTDDAFSPSVKSWSTHVMNRGFGNGTGSDAGTSTLVIHNVSAEQSGQYICTAKHPNYTLTRGVNLTVTYAKQPEISGETSIKEGDALNLTCRVDSFPPSLITWTRHVMSRTQINQTGSAARTSTLVVLNVTAEDSGRYICTAKHLNNTLTHEVNITVKLFPKILSNSRCEAGPDVLTCVCISQGVPLPTIKWPLLENHTEYSFNTAVSNHTVTNTIALTERNHRGASAVCVSTNANGETKKELFIIKIEKGGEMIRYLSSVTQPGFIISFLIGMLLSTLLFCLVKLCCRKKKKVSGTPVETLEMVTRQKEPQINNGDAVEYAQVQIQGTAEEAEAAAAGQSDVEYSDINVLVLERQVLGKAEQKRGDTTTEYAKINKQKNKKTREIGDSTEEEELKHSGQEMGSEDGTVYSNVMDLMDQI